MAGLQVGDLVTAYRERTRTRHAVEANPPTGQDGDRRRRHASHAGSQPHDAAPARCKVRIVARTRGLRKSPRRRRWEIGMGVAGLAHGQGAVGVGDDS